MEMLAAKRESRCGNVLERETGKILTGFMGDGFFHTVFVFLGVS